VVKTIAILSYITIGVVAVSNTAEAQPASYCDNRKGDEGTQSQLLDRIKRENWRIFPPAEARKRTGEARQATFEHIDWWLNTCCLRRVPAAQASQCRAKAGADERTVRQWDWRSPPRN
jgi:hypothetical protein